MITEQYCSFETAKLLKKKGFNVPTKPYYEDEESVEEYDLYSRKPINWNATEFYAKPSQGLAMRWLREAHSIFISPRIQNFEPSFKS